MEAGLPQLSTPRSSIAITSIVAIIIMAMPGAHIDTSRPDLNVNL
jgi:hypothetical protein